MSVSKEELNTAKELGDFIYGYPTNWIKIYDSVNIYATNSGEELMRTGKSKILNAGQLQLLANVDWASNVKVEVKYKMKNEITKELEERKMTVSMSIIPKEPATFVGGEEELIHYLEENSKGKINVTKIDSIEIQQQSLTKIPGFVSVYFTINENGNTENVKLVVSSNDEETDEVILDLIAKMPKWKEAKDSKGNKVKQEFELTVGGPFVGC